jgi:hypothetical protein
MWWRPTSPPRVCRVHPAKWLSPPAQRFVLTAQWYAHAFECAPPACCQPLTPKRVALTLSRASSVPPLPSVYVLPSTALSFHVRFDPFRSLSFILLSPVQTDCNAGDFAASPGSAFCTQCAVGSISAAGAGSCTVCAAGTYESGRTSCPNCASGFVAPTPGLQSCSICPGGTASDAARVNCVTCGVGTAAPSGSAVCTPCSPGYVAAAGSSICVRPAPHPSPALRSCESNLWSEAFCFGAVDLSCRLRCPGHHRHLFHLCRRHDCGLLWFSHLYCGRQPLFFFFCICSLCAHTLIIPFVQCPSGTIAATNGSSLCAPCAAGSRATGTGNTACTQVRLVVWRLARPFGMF